MRIFKIIIGVFLFLVLAGCDFKKGNPPLATQLETSTEELSDAELWNAAVKELESVNNITVKEDFNTSFYYEGQNIKSHIVSQIDIMNEQLIKLNVSYNTTNNTNYTQTYYIQQQNEKYYLYQTTSHQLVKNELDYSKYEEEENLVYEFKLVSGMPNLTHREEYTQDNNKYVKYTHNFKLNQLPSEWQNMFDDSIQLLLESYNSSSYTNIEIKETVVINETTRTFEKVTYDLSNIMKAALKSSFLSSANTVTSTYTISFENRGSIKINTKILKEANIDDAPDTFNHNFLTFPEISGTNPYVGNANYTEDKDIVKIHIDDSNEYTFQADQNVSLSILSKDGNSLYSGDSTVFGYLEPGDYYLKIFSESYVGNYQISLSKSRDDYADFIKDIEHLGIIDANKTYQGTIEYQGDLDIFQLSYSETQYQYYTFKLNTDKNIKVTLLLNNHSLEYVPHDGIIKFGYALSPREKAYIQIESDDFDTYQFQTQVYSEVNDAPERMDDPTIRTIAINQPIQEAIHKSNDDDFFKFTVYNQSYYEFYFSIIVGTAYFYGDVELYDANGNFLTNEFTHELSPGDYYLKVSESSGTLYELTITPIIDEFSIPTTLTLTGSNHVINSSIDYTDDIDEFDLKVNEEGYYQITISEQNKEHFNIIIKDEFNNVVLENNKFYDTIYFIYFYPGTYSFHISGVYSRGGKDYSVTINSQGDISSDIGYTYQMDERYLGIITLGQDVKINYEYTKDTDVYKLSITEPGTFTTFGPLVQKIIDENGNEIPIDPNKPTFFRLNEGIYYLYFYGQNRGTHNFKMVSFIDDYLYYQTYQLPVNTVTTGILDYSTDVDQLQVTITEPGIYEYTIDSSKVKLEIYDENNNMVNTPLKTNSNTIQLINQTYKFRFTFSGYFFTEAIPYSISLNLKSTELDSDPDVAYLPKDMYRALTVGEVISSKFDSADDIDVYIIEVTDGAYYNFHFEPMIWPAKIVHENGNKNVNSDRYYLHAGINYLLLANDNIIDYKLSISK